MLNNLRSLAAFAFVALLIAGTPSESALGQVRRQLAPGPETDPAQEIETESETGDESETKPAEEDRSFHLFGEPSKFNRFSGWGGIGGTMGQWGMNRSMLVMMPAVQDDLLLTDDQKTLLREWSIEMRERGRLMAEAMRPENGGEGGLRPGPNGRMPAIGDIMGMMGMMTQLLKENEAGIARFLDKDQRRRLDEIALQMEGATALARPEVAQAVGLLPAQVEAIQNVIARSKTQQIFHWVQQSASMWNNRDQGRNRNANGDDDGDTPNRPAPAPRRAQARPASPPAPAQAETKPDPRPEGDPGPRPRDDDDDDDDPRRPAEDRADRADREARFREQFDQLRTGSDQIQDRTVQEIMKILTRRQRQRFDKLLGPPFDPNALAFTPPPADRDRSPDRTSPEPRPLPSSADPIESPEPPR